MKIHIQSLSAWLKLPPRSERKLVVKLPDGFSVHRHGTSFVTTDRLEYFLVQTVDEAEKQAGSASVIEFFGDKRVARPVAYWVDTVYLEPEYRGQNYMRNLLHFAMRDCKTRPLLLDAHRANVSTYLAVGFQPMDKQQLQQNKRAIAFHRSCMKYDKPLDEYIPLILT